MKLVIPDFVMSATMIDGERYIKQSDLVAMLLSAASESDPDLRPILSFIAERLTLGKKLED